MLRRAHAGTSRSNHINLQHVNNITGYYKGTPEKLSLSEVKTRRSHHSVRFLVGKEISNSRLVLVDAEVERFLRFHHPQSTK